MDVDQSTIQILIAQAQRLEKSAASIWEAVRILSRDGVLPGKLIEFEAGTDQSMANRIHCALEIMGPCTLHDLMRHLGAKRKTVSNALSRDPRFVGCGLKKWGLAARVEPVE